MDISNRRLLVTRHILPICSIVAVVILWSLWAITTLDPVEHSSPTLDKNDSGEQIVEVPAHNSSHMKVCIMMSGAVIPYMKFMLRSVFLF